MSYTSGTSSNIGGSFSFPSGTALYGVQILGYPEMSMGERNITNHAAASDGKYYEQRVPNSLNVVGDFTLSVLNTPGAFTQLDDARRAGTIENTCYLTDPVGGMLFSGWIKSVMQENADAKTPDNLMLTVVVTPVGAVTLTGGH